MSSCTLSDSAMPRVRSAIGTATPTTARATKRLQGHAVIARAARSPHGACRLPRYAADTSLADDAPRARASNSSLSVPDADGSRRAREPRPQWHSSADLRKKESNCSSSAGVRLRLTRSVERMAMAQPIASVCIASNGIISIPRKQSTSVPPLTTSVWPAYRSIFSTAAGPKGSAPWRCASREADAADRTSDESPIVTAAVFSSSMRYRTSRNSA
mmetsp:Transcript_22097/g.77453  ORF Transcript_22097/g.77453 Transcript_22097/m.77453 type:complete len:215 (+) Transcript_22097:1248-1892(+)